jgi:hypothetical protein
MPRIIDRIVMRFRNKANFLRPAFTWDGWEGLTCLPFGELRFRRGNERRTSVGINRMRISSIADRLVGCCAMVDALLLAVGHSAHTAAMFDAYDIFFGK